ncbi:MAG: cupredoxin domain-containing protein [Candidatus Paceibacterota bacterium]
MSKKQLIILILIVAAVLVALLTLDKNDISDNLFNEAPSDNIEETIDIESVEEDNFEGIKDIELTEPDRQIRAARNIEAQIRTFNVIVSSSGYSLEEIVVNQGDTVDIRLTSPEGNYDIEIPDYGLYQNIPQGESRILNFQTTNPGEFIFQCRDNCPDGNKINGRLIVKPIE